jgi:hypothetical protein
MSTIRYLSGLAGVLGAIAITSSSLAAQERLVANRNIALSPVFETWQFADGVQHGTGNTRIQRATQLSLPITAAIAITEQWTFDVTTAFANGTVRLESDPLDPGAPTSSDLTLSGIADVRVRATGRFFDERVLLTIGAVAPSGSTNLDPEELSALRVLSAPALSFQTPLLGGGAGAIVGVVLARPAGQWGLAAGTSYEYRGRYTPATLAAGIPTPDFSPGGVVHFSLGADGLVGRHGATLTASLDVFGNDRFEARDGATPGQETRLGPVGTIDARLNLATSTFRELTLYVIDRYRTSFKRGDETVDESSGNYLDAGVQSLYPLAPRTGLLVAINARHQTGLGFESSIQTAAIASGALTLGISHAFAGGLELAPFVRGQLGTLESGDESTSVRGVAGGVTLTRRF